MFAWWNTVNGGNLKGGQRAVLLAQDGNLIDTMFVDRRGKEDCGNTLVVTCEGNAGYYETGIMVTPLSLGYSVLGWNHPGKLSLTLHLLSSPRAHYTLRLFYWNGREALP